MIWWRPLKRSAYRTWTLGLGDFEARGIASPIIAKHFNVFALFYGYANDRDHVRW